MIDFGASMDSGASVRRRYIDLEWGQVHVRETAPSDDGTRAIIFLHQSPLSSESYQGVLPLIGRYATGIAVDTPGYGMSDPPTERWDLAAYGAAIAEIVRALGYREYVLIGQHTGGYLALQAAAQLTAGDVVKIRGVGLHGFPTYTPEERAWRLDHYLPAFPRAADGGHLTALWQRAKDIYPNCSPERYTRVVLDYLLADDYAASYRALFEFEPSTLLSKGIGVPILMICGELDVAINRHRAALEMLEHDESVELPRVGDFVGDDDPAAFARCIGDFALRCFRREFERSG